MPNAKVAIRAFKEGLSPLKARVVTSWARALDDIIKPTNVQANPEKIHKNINRNAKKTELNALAISNPNKITRTTPEEKINLVDIDKEIFSGRYFPT